MPDLDQVAGAAEGLWDRVRHVVLPSSMPAARGLMLLRQDEVRIRLVGVDCHGVWVRVAESASWNKACDLISLNKESLASRAPAFELLAEKEPEVSPGAPP